MRDWSPQSIKIFLSSSTLLEIALAKSGYSLRNEIEERSRDIPLRSVLTPETAFLPVDCKHGVPAELVLTVTEARTGRGCENGFALPAGNHLARNGVCCDRELAFDIGFEPNKEPPQAPWQKETRQPNCPQHLTRSRLS